MERSQRRNRRPQRACALGLACTAGAVVAARSNGFVLPGKEAQRAATAAGVAAILATSMPAIAEDVSLAQRLDQRDTGLLKIEQERKKETMSLKDLEKLERTELSSSRSVEKELLKRFTVEEKKKKATADANEKAVKVKIEKEEKDAKAKIDQNLKKEISQIEAEEKASVADTRKVEQAEKAAARAAESKEKAAANGNEPARNAAAEKAEGAIIAAAERSEARIIAAKDKSEAAVKAAYARAEDARAAVAEKAEAAEKAAADAAEKARTEAGEAAEAAEREVVEQEEATEREVLEAVEAIEKKELLAENAGLETAKVILAGTWQVIGPAVIPGIAMALYAVIASFFAEKPEPALGAESEDTRMKMGRKARISTTTATIDPWEKEPSKDLSKVKVAAGATAGAALMAVAQAAGTGTGAFVAGAAPRAAPLPARATAMAPRGALRGSTAAPAAAGTSMALVGALAGGLSVAGFLRASKRTARSGAKAQKANVVRQAVANEISEENPLRVIIAGGGVGGLLLAKALTKEKHVTVNLLEQTSQFARFGGPIQIASNALSVIRAVDETLFNTLMEKFTFTGCRRNGLVDALRTEWYCPFDAMETSADYFELPYTGVVDRPDLQDILLESLPEGTLTNSKKVAKYKILDDAQGVEVTCEDGSVHEGDVYIGADGIWSATRSQMWNEPKKGPGSGCTYSGYVVFAGETVYKPEDYFDVGYKVYMGPKRYFVTSDVGRGRIQWYAFISMAENAQVPEDKTEKKEFIRSAFQGWSQQVLDLVDATPTGNVEDRALYDRPPSLTKSWAEGPVAMMGDAVHPMMPNLGQGGCQAMEDAFAILERFQTVKRRTEVPDLLQDYYRSRVLRASAIQGLSRIASDLLLSTFTFPWKPEEGLSGPYGKGMGDFNSDAVIVNYLKYLLPTIFNVQFSFLYSYHPYKWTAKEVKELVGTVMDRHRVQAEEAWEEREKKVIDGTAQSEDATVGASFFAKVASTA